MRLGISMWSLVSEFRAGHMDVAAFIRFAARCDAEGVELLDYFWRDGGREALLARELVREHGLTISAYAIGNDFVQIEAEGRAGELGRVRAGVDMALLLGTPRLRVFSGSEKPGVPVEMGLAWIVEGLREGAAYAGEHGVTLVLENHGLFAGRADQVRRIIEAVGSSHLRANVDTGNFLLVNQDPVGAIRDLTTVTAYVHLKDFRLAGPQDGQAEAYIGLDGRRYVGTVIGAGAVDLLAVLGVLRDAGYDGWLSIEYEGSGDVVRDAAQSVRAAQELLRAIGA